MPWKRGEEEKGKIKDCLRSTPSPIHLCCLVVATAFSFFSSLLLHFIFFFSTVKKRMVGDWGMELIIYSSSCSFLSPLSPVLISTRRTRIFLFPQEWGLLRAEFVGLNPHRQKKTNDSRYFSFRGVGGSKFGGKKKKCRGPLWMSPLVLIQVGKKKRKNPTLADGQVDDPGVVSVVYLCRVWPSPISLCPVCERTDERDA